MLVVVAVFSSLEVFLSLLFDVIPHHSVSYRLFYPYGNIPMLYSQPSTWQSDSRHFHLNFVGHFIYRERDGFEWAVLTHRHFFFTLFPHILAHLWLRWEQEHTIYDPPLYACSQELSFPATHGLELFGLQDRWFANCASEPRNIKTNPQSKNQSTEYVLDGLCLLKVIYM